MHPGVLIVTVLAGVFTVAIIALLVSKNAQTGSVIQSAASGLSSVIGAAVSPVTGGASGGQGTGALLSYAAGNYGTSPTASPV